MLNSIKDPLGEALAKNLHPRDALNLASTSKYNYRFIYLIYFNKLAELWNINFKDGENLKKKVFEKYWEIKKYLLPSQKSSRNPWSFFKSTRPKRLHIKIETLAPIEIRQYYEEEDLKTIGVEIAKKLSLPPFNNAKAIRTWLTNPKNAPFFRKITDLNLSQKFLKTFPVEATNLTYLRELNLSNNSIEKLPVEMSRLKDLESIQIHSNQLTSVPWELKHCFKIYTMTYHNNPIS